MSVYALKDPRDGRCRYIGRSRSPSGRLQKHIEDPHSDRIRDWIGELQEVGLTPQLTIMDGGTEAEWISRLKPDLNVRAGATVSEPDPLAIPRRMGGGNDSVRSIRVKSEEWSEIERAAKYSSVEIGTFIRTEALRAARRVNQEAANASLPR